MNHFTNQWVLITGALGSLGRAQAQAFAAEGAHLLLLDRPGHAEANDFVRELQTHASGTVRYLGQDLSDLARSAQVVGEMAQQLGGLDVLVNNAALIINKPFEQFSLGEYEEQLRVNAGAAFALAQAVAPGMKAKQRGRIVNLCSVTLNGRWDGYVPYVASKGAMLGLTKSLARELGPHGVRVNAVSPGAVVSQAEARVFGDRLQQYQDWILENQSLKTRIEPRHVADLIVFLSSPAADMISGQNIAIDGGW